MSIQADGTRTGTSEQDRVDEWTDVSFSISRLQILDHNGRLVGPPEPDLTVEQLHRLYRSMVLARGVDARLLKLQRQGRIGTFPPATGQEAAVCGPALAMGEKDWFTGSFRELGARLMLGEPVESTFIYHSGYEEGNACEGCERMLPLTVIIASQNLHAVGIAYAMKLKGEKDTAVVSFVGDGGTSEGDFHEAMNFASVWQVPVVFICQNNQWGISVSRKMQTHSRTLAQKAIAYDMPGIQVDGNDALAMYQAAHEALQRAKAGEGPSFIEAVTYRMLMHTTADDPTKYRTEEELQYWQKRDPLTRMRKYLESKDIWSEEQQNQLDNEVKERVEQAVRNFESRTDYKPDAPFDFVYGTRHPRIEEQRAEFLDNLKKDKEAG